MNSDAMLTDHTWVALEERRKPSFVSKRATFVPFIEISTK